MKPKTKTAILIEWAVDISKHLLFWGIFYGVLIYAFWQIGQN